LHVADASITRALRRAQGFLSTPTRASPGTASETSELLDEELAGRWRCGVAGYLERLDRKAFNGKASPRLR
jgi:hypothetical protein